MAEFDWSKYKKAPKADTAGAGVPQEFDWSQYERVNVPQSQASLSDQAAAALMGDANQIRGGLEDIAGGAREGIQNLGAFLTQKLPEGYQIPRYEATPQTQYGRLPIEVGKIASSFIPGVGAERLAGAALEGAGLLPQALNRILSGAAGGAASSPSVDADPLVGAALGGGFSAIPEGVRAAVGRYVGGNKPVEEFEQARDLVPEGIKAPIGELADSPRAKQDYGLVRGIPLSGSNAPYQQLYNNLSEGVESLNKGTPSMDNPGKFIYEDMRNQYEAAKGATNDAYNQLAEYADNSGVPFNRESFDSSLDEALNEVNSKVKNSTTKKLYGDAIDALQDFKNTPIDTFGDAVNIRPALNDLIKQASKSDDKITSRYLQKIKSALDNGIRESSTQDPNLLSLHEAANDARIYQGEFENLNRRDKTPFYKLYSKDAEPQRFVEDYLKRSKRGSDYSPLLESLTDKISPEAKDVLATTFLKPSSDTSLAKQLSNLRDLSPSQRNILFGEDTNLANQLADLSGVFPEAASADFVPKTGYTGAKILQGMLASGGAGLGATGHPLTAVLTATGFPLAGRAVQNVLRSDALKNTYANYLRQRAGQAINPSSRRAERLARTLANRLAGGNDGS